jgi:hypothetical protein
MIEELSKKLEEKRSELEDWFNGIKKGLER